MNINILVNGGLYDAQSGYTALRYCHAATAAGHKITQVFFYQQGVTQASQFALPLADEFDAPQAWSELAAEYAIPLLVCVSAAERRGVIGEDQAEELTEDKAALKHLSANLHPSFAIAGLGALHEASMVAERTVTFK